MPPASSDPKPYLRAGLLVVLVFFGGIGAWASLAPLRGALIGPGVVTVISNRKTVQHLEGGIVAELFVVDGARVEGGQPLLRLDDTRARAGLDILDNQLDLMRTREARLVAERDAHDELVAPERIAARAELPQVAEILDGERELFQARRTALRGEVDILARRTEQLRDEIGGLEAQRRSTARQVELVEEELAGLRRLLDEGFTARNRIREFERELEQLRGALGEHVAAIARAKNAIGEAELRSIQLEKDFREGVVEELHEVQGRIFDLEDRRVAASDELDRLLIRAPQAGTVVGMSIHTVGAVVEPGHAILDIVPDDDELVIESQMRPEDVDKLHVGQPALVRLTAFDRRSTPELNGTVIHVSADRIRDPASGRVFYLVRTRIPEQELGRLGDLELLPGMPAETFVATGSRTVLSYLLKPLSDGFARALRED